MTKARARPAYPCLEVPGPEGEPVRYRIVGREATVGRDPSNDICIPQHLVSKFHAKLLVANQSVTVIDLNSVNHTRVNGQVVTQSAVRYGDELQFARVKCRLVLLEAEARGMPEGEGVSA
jgi:pSer/pThr/pTyr-binding forkhead associated (FHA) protein